MVNWLIVFSLLLCSCTAMAEMVDLSPNETGDRIALVQGGQVRYLSANRVEWWTALAVAVHADIFAEAAMAICTSRALAWKAVVLRGCVSRYGPV